LDECRNERVETPGHPSRRDDYDDADFYRQQVEKEERLARLR